MLEKTISMNIDHHKDADIRKICDLRWNQLKYTLKDLQTILLLFWIEFGFISVCFKVTVLCSDLRRRFCSKSLNLTNSYCVTSVAVSHFAVWWGVMTPASRAKGNNILTYRNLDIPCKLLLISRLGFYISGVLGAIINGEAYPRGFPTGSKQDVAELRQIRFEFTGQTDNRITGP